MHFVKVTAIRSLGMWLLLGSLVMAMSALAAAQEPGPPPPPPGGPGMVSIQGPGFGGGFFHEDIGEGHKVVKGAPMTSTISVTRDTTLSDGNTIHTQQQSTVYRDSEGRVRREVPFQLVTPTTGATKGTMIVITDPVSGNRYMLNPQTKVAHQMPMRESRAQGVNVIGAEPIIKPGAEDVVTEQLGTKTILGLQATGTRMTHTIPEGQIGNAKPIVVVTERWVSNDLQIPLTMTHTDPMMGTMSSTVTSVTRGEPDASLFQVPSDYKIEAGKHGDMMYMPAKP
jgi:hypothetical protein